MLSLSKHAPLASLAWARLCHPDDVGNRTYAVPGVVPEISLLARRQEPGTGFPHLLRVRIPYFLVFH